KFLSIMYSIRKYIDEFISFCRNQIRSICQYHDTLYPDENLIDLQPNSNYFDKLPFKILEPYFKDLDNKIENLIPPNILKFPIEFFQQYLTGTSRLMIYVVYIK